MSPNTSAKTESVANNQLWHETTGNGQPLFLVHGWGMNASVWQGLLEPLQRHYQVTRVELPGHGGSAPLANGNQLADWAAAVSTVAPSQAIWVGWSLGGQLVLQAAAMARQGLLKNAPRALLLVGTNPCFAQRDDWPCAMSTERLQQLVDNYAVDGKAAILRFLTLQIRGSARSRDLLKQLRSGYAARPSGDHQSMQHGLQMLREVDLRDDLTGLNLPMHWLFGEMDTLVPACVVNAVAELVPDAVLEIIDNSGHVPFLSQPELFIQSIDALAARSGWLD